MNKDSLSLQDVTKEYRQGSTTLQVIRNCSIDFTQGTSYAITGISGSGKSTLIHLLAGIDQPSAGNVLYNNNPINQLTAAQRSFFFNRTIGLVFQLPYLFKELSVIENCMVPGLIAGKEKIACRERATMLLEQVGLSEKIESKPSTLSGGQQQRAVIARALFNQPSFLLADEPTGNLDVHTGTQIIDLLLQCQADYQMGLIMSTHDAYVAQRLDVTFQVYHQQLIRN